MTCSAPRYDPRILDALRSRDDRSESMAEVCRRVARDAEALGLPRPSYVHLRRLLLDERALQDEEKERRDARRAVITEVVENLVAGLGVNPYEVAERLQQASERPPAA